MESAPPPDGYRRAPDGVGIILIDPTDCPGCGRFRFGQRQNVVHCPTHGTHNSWMCRCGTWIYRGVGEFVAELDCLTARPAPERRPGGPADA